jgi:hypothetical protein
MRGVIGRSLFGVSVLAVAACGGPPAARQDASPAASVSAVTTQEQPGRTMIDAKPLSLQEMAQSADRIVVAVVKRVEARPEQVSEGSHATTAEIRTVTLEVNDGIKGAKAGATIIIRQLVEVSSPIEVGDEVLWFLSPNSKLGLTQPLGVFSGDFRIETTPTGRVVANLRGNEGLWEGSLWSGDGFDRSLVLREAQLMKVSSSQLAMLERTAAQNPDDTRIPLELVVAATRSQTNR